MNESHCSMRERLFSFALLRREQMITNNETQERQLKNSIVLLPLQRSFHTFLIKDDATKYQCSVPQIHLLCSYRLCHFSTSNKDSLVSTWRLSEYAVALLLFNFQKLHSYTRDKDGHRAIFTRLVPFSSWPMGAAHRPRLVIC
jgi:hypothetical protein